MDKDDLYLLAFVALMLALHGLLYIDHIQTRILYQHEARLQALEASQKPVEESSEDKTDD